VGTDDGAPLTTKARKPLPVRPVPTFDHLAKKPPIELRDLIPLNQEAALAYAQAKAEADSAELMADPERIAAATAALEETRQALAANSVEVIFRSIGRPKFEKLKREHPPTEAQKAEFKTEYGVDAEYNPDTFSAALIAASCVQPEMTPQQVQSLADDHDWNAGEIQHLFQLALQVNTQRRAVDWDF
jgi:hypothetical protein